jgi:uncharacterized membrane protein HdeD (DUF308 family)
MKTITIKWVDLLDALARILLWILLFFNLTLNKYDVAVVYALVIIAWVLSDIAVNTRKNDE